jgi:endonuclease/exonuclease/phosphatase family metal-dependent hydrolase
MRLASYNVENLFERAKALNQDSWTQGKPILEKFSSLSKLLCKKKYSPADKTKIKTMLIELGLEKSDQSEFVLLRQNRGKLIKRGAGGLEVVADGFEDWIGWIELRREPVNERAMLNTGQVIRDVNADVLAVVEAEDRVALERFSERILKQVGGQPYRHAMLIDGNDERGIDVGLLSRAGYSILEMRSHVDDEDAQGEIFSRDCPEYLVRTTQGNNLWVLVNHFKSKGFGSQSDSNARRARQAKRVREIYDALIARGEKYVAVLGDLNDTPDSAPLAALLGQGSSLRDISTHPTFNNNGRPGTHGNSTASSKIDYVLLSPALFNKTTGGEIFRKGIWGGVNGTLWEIYPEMEKAVHAASDHAAIWADIDV